MAFNIFRKKKGEGLEKGGKTPLSVRSIMQDAFCTAERAGWYDPPRTDVENHMLFVAEIAEATEAVRSGEDPFYIKDGKPEGEVVELADAIIRIADYCQWKGYDLEEALRYKLAYNKTRPRRHGGKKL